MGKRKGKAGLVAAGIITAVSIGVCAVAIPSLTDHRTPQGGLADPSLSQSAAVNSLSPALEQSSGPHTQQASVLSVLPLSTEESDRLIELYALIASENAYDGTPAYLFLGRKADRVTDPELDEYMTEESKAQAQAQSYIATYSDLLSLAREASISWTIPYEDAASYLTDCICIQTEQYIFVAAGEQYKDLAIEFEKNSKDTTILDTEDMLARIVSDHAALVASVSDQEGER